MLSKTLDLTDTFNNNSSKATIDSFGWDYVLVQIQTPSGTINFGTTNDAGAIEGVSDGNALTAINYQAAQGLNTATNTSASSTASNGIFKFNVAGRFLQFSGSSVTVNKMIATLSMIN